MYRRFERLILGEIHSIKGVNVKNQVPREVNKISNRNICKCSERTLLITTFSRYCRNKCHNVMSFDKYEKQGC